MTITSKYNGKCKRCGLPFSAGAQIEWSRTAGATHLTLAQCDAARQAAAAEAAARQAAAEARGFVQDSTAINMKPLVDFLSAAKERGLKFPKARFIAPDGRSELRLSVAGAKSKVPGSVQVVLGDLWIGRVEPNGAVVGSLQRREDVLRTLRTVAADPAKAAKEFGALMSRCSFCDKALTDAGSVAAGYGPICARKYNLPWEKGGTALGAAPAAPKAGSLTALAAKLSTGYEQVLDSVAD